MGVKNIIVTSSDKTERVETEIRNRKGSVLRRFLEETSLPGWKYLVNEDSVGLKLIWLVTLLGTCVFSMYAMYKYTDQYLTATIITSINSTISPISDISYPSVYICNVNPYQLSFLLPLVGTENNAYDILNTFNDEFIYGKDQGETNKTIVEKLEEGLKKNYNWTKDIPASWMASQNCSDMIISAVWPNNKPKTFFPAYKRVTDKHQCCHIIPAFDFGTNTENEPERQTSFSGRKWKPKDSIPLGAKSGVGNSLELFLDTESFEEVGQYSSGNTGFLIALGDPQDVPFTKDNAQLIAPGFSTLASVVPSKVSTTLNAISRFSAQTRECRNDSEYSLMFLSGKQGYRYSLHNCLFDIVVQNILNNCSCFYPISVVEGPQICRGASLGCARLIYFQMGDGNSYVMRYSNGSATQPIKCLPACEFQTNTFSLSSSPFPSEAAFPYMNGSCYLMKKIIRICTSSNEHRVKLFKAKYPKLSCDIVNKTFIEMCDQNFTPYFKKINESNPIYKSLLEYAQANVAHVQVFIKDPFYTQIKRDEEIAIWTYIGNAGGMLGLYLGLTLISFFEMIYFVGICACKFLSGSSNRTVHVRD